MLGSQDQSTFGNGRVLSSETSHTDWSMIRNAAHGEPEEAADAWEKIGRRYWPAIYAYIRSSGKGVEESADLTQGFICDVLIGRELVHVADPKRGRFRSLLLKALKNYIIEQHRRSTTRRRSPEGSSVIDLDPQLLADIPVSNEGQPDAAFDAQWGATLIRRVLERVRQSCVEEELTAHWKVFEARVVKPLLMGQAPVGHGQLVDMLSLKDAAQASNMMITVKRRFAKALIQEVGRTVGDPSQIEDELHELRRVLEQRS